MRDLNDKNTGNSLLATEWNEIPSELQNLIESTGQTLTEADVEQVVKSLAHYAANGTFYVDIGIADSYLLTVIGSNVVAPTYHNGREVEFIVANTNTGASTVNVSTVGVKGINGTDAPGALTEGIFVRLRYDINTDAFDIVSTSDISNGLFTGDYIASLDSEIIARDFTVSPERPINFGAPGRSDGEFLVLDFFPGSGVTTHALRGVAVNQSNGDVWVADGILSNIFRAANGSTDWLEPADGYPFSSDPQGIAVDSVSSDVFVLDNNNNRVRKLTGGVGVWEEFGISYNGNEPIYIAVNDTDKDVWVVDGDIFSGGSGPGLTHVPGGAGGWLAFDYPGTVPIAIAINQSSLDVWVVDSTESVVYKRTSNEGLFSTSGVGSYPGSAPVAIAVNSITGGIWIEDSTDGIYYSSDGAEDWVLVSNHGIDINYLAVYDDVGRLYGAVSDTASEDVLFEADGTNVDLFIKT